MGSPRLEKLYNYGYGSFLIASGVIVIAWELLEDTTHSLNSLAIGIIGLAGIGLGLHRIIQTYRLYKQGDQLEHQVELLTMRDQGLIAPDKPGDIIPGKCKKK